MARKQQDIPGTEPVRIQKLEDCAAAYRALVRDRMAMQQKEAEAKAELQLEIHRQIEKGVISVPPGAEEDLVPVYKFASDEEDEGELVVRWGRRENVKVGRAKGEDAENLV